MKERNDNYSNRSRLPVPNRYAPSTIRIRGGRGQFTFGLHYFGTVLAYCNLVDQHR